MFLSSVIFKSGRSVGAILESIRGKLLLPKMVSAASEILSLQLK